MADFVTIGPSKLHPGMDSVRRTAGPVIVASKRASGIVRMPITEYTAGASYTFEYQEGDGPLYRWVGQQPDEIEPGVAVFNLRACDAVLVA